MIGKNTKLFFLATLLMMSVASFGQNVRGFYLTDVGSWLGDASEENEILQYAQGNGFNYILFYDLGDINWNSSSEKNQLGAFIHKARTQYGITEIGGVVEYSGYVTQKLIPYNNSRTRNTEKFDVINLEFEFWVSSSISGSYCSKFLNAAGMACTKAGAWQFAWREFQAIDNLCAANNMKSEVYLGWPELDQMQKLAGRADRILLSAYRPTDSDIYQYSKQRLKDIASIGGTTKVITLMSSQSSFMGPWLNSHPQTRPYQTMSAALAAETGSFKQHINLEGYHWFTYDRMPHTMLVTASISASGPLTFCPGGSVTLTANSGSQYLWNPNGETTRSITVTTAGSYSVRVTDANGTNVTSAPAVVSNNGSGAIPTVSVSGPVSFCPGGSVTLTSSSANSYLWTNGATTRSITVTTSGTYKVTTGGSSCSGTSNGVVVNANSTPPVPTVTANGALGVCPGSVLTLTSSAANGYKWSSGETTRSIVVGAAGTYSVKAYSGPNCFSQSTSKTVTMLSAPAMPNVAVSGSTTLDSITNPSVTLTSSTASAYSWSNGASTRATTISTQGSYRVTITGANGCKSTSKEINVIKNGCVPPIAPVIIASGPTTFRSGQNVVLTSTLSSGYRWSNGATTRSITVSSAGSYNVRSYNGGGCYSTSLPVNIVVLQTREANPEMTGLTDMNVFPNPANDQLNIAFNATVETKLNVKLIDISGREIQSMDVNPIIGENKVQMDVSNLTPGIYFAYLVGEGQKQVMKVVVE